ncbi:hypothetical protein K7432_000147 [Basidiobolus ranarum]|uniref:Uncharacterized protein n=1 Tax=Basidiobolus ranarum TaxID=34480 RepID=A0ABR2WBM9_9FUNG
MVYSLTGDRHINPRLREFDICNTLPKPGVKNRPHPSLHCYLWEMDRKITLSLSQSSDPPHRMVGVLQRNNLTIPISDCQSEELIFQCFSYRRSLPAEAEILKSIVAK